MVTELSQLATDTNALRLDWSALAPLDVDAGAVRTRSAVFQRTFSPAGNGKEGAEGESMPPRIPVYVKIYTYRKHPFQRWCRPGRSRIEARNLLFFNSIGIPAPRVIGWNERRNTVGRIIEEFIITETIADAVPLDEFVQTECPDRSLPVYRERREALIEQIAASTQKLHARNFFHKDLKWRNLLARFNDGEVEVFWIDCPTGSFSRLPGKRHHRLKDCATLDKLARLHCTEEERLSFLATYLGTAVDDPEVRRFGDAVSRYRQRRFDPKDNWQRAQAHAKH